MKPYVGQIVLFQEWGQKNPALITRVHDESRVDLVVFSSEGFRFEYYRKQGTDTHQWDFLQKRGDCSCCSKTKSATG